MFARNAAGGGRVALPYRRLRLRDDIKAMQPGPGLTSAQVDVATFKERYGLTRKFAIPLLEWLDKERVTRRTGDKRIVL